MCPMNGDTTSGRNHHSSMCNGLPYYNCTCRKTVKALIDSGATISLLRYSAYKNIDDWYKTPIQLTTAKLNTADGSSMSAIGLKALHLRIADLNSHIIL